MHSCLQIDCVTVKGSTQPMGLFTYDITLEHVAGPGPASSGGGSPSGAGVEANGGAATISHAGYDNEFEEHPDLSKCDASPTL